MFSLDQKVVYPGYGVAKISRILEKKVAGSSVVFYELRFLSKDITVLVPTHGVESVGLRPISSIAQVSSVLRVFEEPLQQNYHQKFTASNWNKRSKEYQMKLRRGDLKEISEMYRDLSIIETQKELSFGEKSILQQAEGLLTEEISVVTDLEPDNAVEKLRSLCNTTKKQYRATL